MIELVHTCREKPNLPCDACGILPGPPYVVDLDHGEDLYVIVKDTQISSSHWYIVTRYTLTNGSLMQFVSTETIDPSLFDVLTDSGRIPLAVGYKFYKEKTRGD